MASEKGKGALALGGSILAFCCAMGLHDTLNIWVGTGLAGVASLLLVWLGGGPTLSSMFKRPLAAQVLAGALVGFAMSVATWWLYPISTAILPPIEPEVEALYALLRQTPGPARALPVLVLVVAAEELVWRGLAIGIFRGSLGPARAVLISALLYVLPQVVLGSPLLVVVALVCGVLWGAVRIRAGGLAAPFAAHLVWNLLVFVLYPVA